MTLPTSRSTRNQEHALSLAYAVRGLLNTRGNRIHSIPQLEAIEEAQNALKAFAKDNTHFDFA